MAMALHNARKFARAVKAKHAWTAEEVECAYILYLMIPVKRKQQRVDFLNVSFRNGRTYTAFEDRIRKIRHAQNNYYGHLPVKYECWAGDVETALDTLSRLLGRTVVFEENTLWYREELIVLATISSGPSSLEKIQRRLEKSYHIQRGLDEIESQMARLQCSTRSASGALLYPSHTIWASYHQSQYVSPIRHRPVAAGDGVATRIPTPGIRYLASAIRASANNEQGSPPSYAVDGSVSGAATSGSISIPHVHLAPPKSPFMESPWTSLRPVRAPPLTFPLNRLQKFKLVENLPTHS